MEDIATIGKWAQDLPENEERFTRDRKTESALFVAKMTSGIRKSIFAIRAVVALHYLQGGHPPRA